jgi:hypothetical protein
MYDVQKTWVLRGVGLCLCLALSGCATVSVTPFEPLQPGASPRIADVYTSHDSVRRPYREVALLTINLAPDRGGVEKMKQKAQEIGADGLILLEPSSGSEDGHSQAAAIVYTEEGNEAR